LTFFSDFIRFFFGFEHHVMDANICAKFGNVTISLSWDLGTRKKRVII